MSLFKNWVEYLARVGDASQEDSDSSIGNALINEFTKSISGWPRQELIRSSFTECITILENFKTSPPDRMTKLSRAWTSFATGCLLLYLPDKPFDPSLRVMIERENYHIRRTQLQAKLDAL